MTLAFYGLVFVFTLAAAIFCVWPLARSAKNRTGLIACVFVLVAAPFTLYRWLGNPASLEWLDARRHYAETAAMLKDAVLQSKGNPQLLLMYGKSLTMAADGRVTPDAAEAFKMVLLQEPGNPQARFFLAVGDIQAGRPKIAMKKLQTLQRVLPQGLPLRAMVDRKIEELKEAKP